jgi:hypothetical protein
MAKRESPKAQTTKTSLMLPKPLWTSIKIRALQEERDAQDLVAEALADYLRRVKKGGDRR